MRILWLFIFSIALFSCEDELQINSISGKLYRDCSNSPATSKQVALKAQATQSFSEPEIIASAFTNSSGSFQFTYELGEKKKGTGDLFLVNQDGLEPLIEGLTLNTNLELTLYEDNFAQVEINNSGNRLFSNQDTLYLGISPGDQEFEIANLTNGVLDTLLVSVLNQQSSTESVTIYYGVGSSEFILSKEALSIEDSTLRHKSVNLSGCSQLEIVDLVLN